MSRAIINVATGTYVKGQQRMRERFGDHFVSCWTDTLPPGCPAHSEIPYAFKAYGLHEYAKAGYETLLWADACIVPGARPLADLWAYIEEHGVWFARNGYSNYEWCADSAYPDLLPHVSVVLPDNTNRVATIEDLRRINKEIPHVVATSFGLSLNHPKGRAFLDEYYRLASQTKAFCGPWINLHNGVSDNPRYGKCGPPDVRGHRHDQTCASVIAWRLGIPLTACPEWFSYRGGETDRTCLIADGAYA